MALAQYRKKIEVAQICPNKYAWPHFLKNIRPYMLQFLKTKFKMFA
jgi:hypothetical protein